MWELENTEKRTNKVLRAAEKYTIDELTVLFRKLFERPAEWEANDKNRIKNANAYYYLFKDVDFYATGTSSNGHQGGPAIVGEGKNSEIVAMPNKAPFVVSDATLFTDMPKGTSVIPIPEYEDGIGMNYKDFIGINAKEFNSQITEQKSNKVQEKIVTDKNNETIEVNVNTDVDVEVEVDDEQKKTREEIIAEIRTLHGDNAELILKLNGITDLTDHELGKIKTYELKNIDPDMSKNNIFELIKSEGRDISTLIEDDKKLIEFAMQKIRNQGETEDEIKTKQDNWMTEYEAWKNDKNNPYYLTYWTDKYTKDQSAIDDVYRYQYLDAKNQTEIIRNSLDLNHDGVIEQKLKSEELNYINRLGIEKSINQLETLNQEKKLIEEYLQHLYSIGADSETIAKAQEEYDKRRDTITKVDSELTNFKKNIGDNIKSFSNFSKQQADNKNMFLSDAYDLGQTTDKAYDERTDNLELALEDALIAQSRYENQFIDNYLRSNEGSTREDALIAMQSDSYAIEFKKAVNSIKKQMKDIVKEELDAAISDLDRTLTKHELTRPDKWDNKQQISNYYDDFQINYDDRIARLKNYLNTAKNLSKDQQKEIIDEIDQLEKQKLESSISYYKDLVSYQESIYSALQYKVNEYIDDLEDEKQAVSERYDEEIEKLTQVNEDKERSIKLTELQQKLENAEKQKKRVYRAGVGFVYESDRNEVKSARQELDSFWRQDKIDDLNTAKDIEIKFYDERIEGWNKYLKGIEKCTKQFESEQNEELLIRELGLKNVDELNNKLIQDRDAFLINIDSQNDVYGVYNAEYSGLFDTFLADYHDYLTELDKLEETMMKPMIERFRKYNDSDVQGIDTDRLVKDSEWKRFQETYGVNNIQGILNSAEETAKYVGKYINGKLITEEYLRRLQTTKNTTFKNIAAQNDSRKLIDMIRGNVENPYEYIDRSDLLQILNMRLNMDGVNGAKIDDIIGALDESKLRTSMSDLVTKTQTQIENNVDLKTVSDDILSSVTSSAYWQYLDNDTQNQIKGIIQEIATWDIEALGGNISTAIENAMGSIASIISQTKTQSDKNASSGSNKKRSSNSTTGEISNISVSDYKAKNTNSSGVYTGAAGYLGTVSQVTAMGYANGTDATDGTTTRSFLAGEEGVEIGVYPDGTVVAYGTNGPEIYENEPLGTTIFTAEESSKILGMYKNGTMNKGINKFTGFSLSNSLDYYKYLMNKSLNMPEYFSTIPKYENINSQKGDTIYEIHTVELPNVQDPSTFWRELNNGVQRHKKNR